MPRTAEKLHGVRGVSVKGGMQAPLDPLRVARYQQPHHLLFHQINSVTVAGGCWGEITAGI